MTKRTDTAIATVRDLAQQGHDDTTIANHLGVSARTVLRWRKHAGIPAGWTGPVPTARCGTPSRYESGSAAQSMFRSTSRPEFSRATSAQAAARSSSSTSTTSLGMSLVASALRRSLVRSIIGSS